MVSTKTRILIVTPGHPLVGFLGKTHDVFRTSGLFAAGLVLADHRDITIVVFDCTLGWTHCIDAAHALRKAMPEVYMAALAPRHANELEHRSFGRYFDVLYDADEELSYLAAELAG